MGVYKKRKIDTLIEKVSGAKEAVILTGFRRVGKTSVIRAIYESIPSTNKVFLDLESPVNQTLFQTNNYDTVLERLSSLEIDRTKKAYIFLDEIQKVPDLPSIVKYLHDHYDIKFYMTGSSSFYLKNHFSESLSGRKYIFELFPLDFEEFLEFKEKSFAVTASYDFLSGLYQEYMRYGGFPAVVLEPSPELKWLKLDDILGSYFELDVKGLSDFRNIEHLKKLLFLISSRVGSKADITKLAQSLDVSRPTIYEYLSFFEQTYLISFLKPISGSRDIQIRSIPKLYFNDVGLLNRIGGVSKGTLFENMVFHQLRTKIAYDRSKKTFLNDRLAYFQLKSGAEIDFVLDRRLGYEVKLHATENDYKKLIRDASSLNLRDCRVISLEQVPDDLLEKMAQYPFSW